MVRAVADRPNILFFHVDNLGFGELSCYSGGPFRGAWTGRIDAFAERGVPADQLLPGVAVHADALGADDRTARDPLGHAQRADRARRAAGAWWRGRRRSATCCREAGYACAVYGKWHVGEGPGRWPTDKGFEEWYGPPRTYDEALWPDDPWYDPERDPVSRMVRDQAGRAPTSPRATS